VAVAGVAEHLRGGERQHGAQPLAARRDQVVGDLGDHLDVGAGLGQDQLVDAAHVGGGQVDQRLDRARLALPIRT
jgi:hypothetical protein